MDSDIRILAEVAPFGEESALSKSLFSPVQYLSKKQVEERFAFSLRNCSFLLELLFLLQKIVLLVFRRIIFLLFLA